MTTMANAMRAILLCALSTAAAACGGPDGLFILRIQSQDVIPAAVDRVEVELTPQMMRRFECREDQVYFEGGARTRVTGIDCAVGTFLVTLEQSYVEANRGVPDDIMLQWYVDVPLYSENPEGQAMTDVLLEARFYRRDVEIANGQRFVTWPLLPGGVPSAVRVVCERAPIDRGAECSNNEPVPRPDGGMMGDGG
jgi:hypothetical protein